MTIATSTDALDFMVSDEGEADTIQKGLTEIMKQLPKEDPFAGL